MSKAHYLAPTGPLKDPITVRLGAGTGSSNNLATADENKFVKLVGDSRYDLCAAGDAIEGMLLAVEVDTAGGYSIGSVIKDREQMYTVTADGLQATLGTGTLAIGDYVVVGTVTAKGTKNSTYPKVAKATIQPGDAPANLTAAAAAVVASKNAWRVVSLLTGAGAVGTAVTIAAN